MEKTQMIDNGAVGADDDERLAQEIERLRRLARDAKRAPGHRGRKAKTSVLAVLGVLAAGVMLVWALSPDAGEQAVQAFSSVERLLGTAPQAQPAAPPDGTPADDSRSAPAHRTPRKSAAETTPSHGSTGLRAAVTPELAELGLPYLLQTFVLAPPESLATVAEADPNASRVYSRLDSGVTPPVPIQPALGRATTDATGIPGDMEVLIGRAGNVERVQLLAPNRYEDRMLIYAMKNRQFKPATVNGRPVRYLLRIRTAS